MNRKHVFLISVFITLLLAALTFPACARAASSFSDVRAGDWYYDAVQYVDMNGLMRGESAARFVPDGSVTRGMIVTAIYRMEGSPKITAACPFRDVAAGMWYKDGITWAAANDIVTGYTAATFGPDDLISREQLAAICYRYAVYKGYDVSERADLSYYYDAKTISSWAKDAFAWCGAVGLINGTGSLLLEPGGRSTRAQAAAILMRFEQNVTLKQCETASVPILTYHNVADGASETVISPAMLESHFAALKKAGYQAVLLSDLRDYVLYGDPLPKKPLVITFDDGYLSNYSQAFPLLKKHDMKAVFFIIGVSFGQSTYKNTGIAIEPHFGTKEAKEMLASGRVELGSHSYDMHQWRPYETGPVVRENLKMLPGDTPDSYKAAVRADARRFTAFYQQSVGGSTALFSYPRGAVTADAAAILREEGFTITATSETGINTIVRGLPRSLQGLRRFNVDGDMTADQVLAMIGE